MNRRRLSIGVANLTRASSSRNVSSTGVEYHTLKQRKLTADDIRRYKSEYETVDHTLDLTSLMHKYGTDIIRGLSKKRADELLTQNGPNALIPPATKSRWLILAEYLFCGFAALLWAGAILTFIGYGLAHMKNPKSSKDSLYLGIMLVGVIFVTGTFGYYQEVQNAKIMDSFNKMIPKQATVIRDGQKMEIPSEELVVGDLVEMKMGDCVPADVRIISSQSMKVDNSAITGESQPQTRVPQCTDENPMETANLAFYSTYVLEGSGMGIVICTGDDTLIGHIAGLTSSVEKTDTPLKKEIKRFVVFITILAITFGIIFFSISLFIGYDIFTSITYFIAIIVANVPEGLLVTLTACMTLTAKRMARKNCLVKNIQAIEALGSCNVICSDKTGTLTQNRMTVSHVYFDGNYLDVLEDPHNVNKKSPSFQALINVATLCSRSKFEENQEDIPILERKVVGDASEAAILKYVEIVIGNAVKRREEFPKVCEIPFRSANKFQISIHRLKNGKYVLVMKGAPEKVLECCSTMMMKGDSQSISSASSKMIKASILNLGNMGERVLGFADLYLSDSYGPNYRFDADKPNFPLNGLRFVGLMSMVDPPRPSVPEAVEKCKSAGIRVIMVTGDHPITAKAIAKKVGIISPNSVTIYDIALQRDISASMVTAKEKARCNAAVITGADLREMDESELESALVKYKEIVFARTTPQQKLKIVEALQNLENIVAVTGDGVNDSPALKKADIGIAMGITGSDVSKETADMILLDDNFASIVTGVEEGRLIFDNLKKSIAYILTSNVPEIVPFLLLVVVNIPQALSVMAIMIIDVGTDLWPAISLAYEKAEADIMKRKPRDMKRDKLVNFRMIYLTYFQIGVIQTAASMISYFFIMAQHGFFYERLIGIRIDWEEHWLNDLEDSYGEEWTYEERLIIQYKCHSAYFLSIVVTQVADLLICKTRRLSLFQQGMTNWVLNCGIIFEILLAGLVVYCPRLNTVLQFAPISGYSVLFAVPFAVLIIGYDEVRKYLIRKNPTGIVFRETYY